MTATRIRPSLSTTTMTATRIRPSFVFFVPLVAMLRHHDGGDED